MAILSQAGDGAQDQADLARLSIEISAATAASGDATAVLQGCAEAVVRRLGGVFARIWLLDEQGALQLAASAGDDGWIGNGHRPYFAGHPLMAGSDVIGVIAAFSPRPLGEVANTALSGIADKVAAGMERNGVGRRLYLQDRAIAASSNGIVITDPHLPDNPIIYANDGFRRMTGYEQAEIIGMNCRFLQAGDIDQEGVRELREAIRERRNAEVVLRNYRKDGEPFYNELSLSPVLDDDGELINFIGIQSDITARVLAERERDELLQRVEEAVRARDRFISVASHELRSPITVIRAHAQLAARRLRRAGDAEVRHSLTLIDRQVSNLETLIGDLLDVGRLETGQLSFERRPLDLCALAREVVEEVERSAAGHELSLLCEEGELTVEGDETRLRQVLGNLLSNALKYSPTHGRVEVRVERSDGHAVVSVQDWGIGIPAEQQGRLFEPYYRAPNASDSGRTGLGLGLHISRNIIQAHNGALSFTSTEGEGSTFYFCLPFTSSVLGHSIEGTEEGG